MNEIPTDDQELQAKAFIATVEGLPRVLAQRKRATGLAVQFHPEHAWRLRPLGLMEDDGLWALRGVPLAPADYIVNVSGEGIRVISRREFEHEWEIVGDA